MANQVHSITPADFAEVFGEMTPRLKRKIEEANLQYTYLSPEERDACILDVVVRILESKFKRAGEHRRQEWEDIWSKNQAALAKSGTTDALVPYYFKGTDSVARWKKELIRPTKPMFDLNGLSIITEWLFEKYMSTTPAIYEFGCGTNQVDGRGLSERVNRYL